MDLIEREIKIGQFWQWFVKNEAKFRYAKDTRILVEEMDNLILDLGRFKWEVGPEAGQFYLVISPNEDLNLLEISSAIMEAAPQLNHWRFYPSYPAKDWDFTFEMYDSFMLKQNYSAANWCFLLFEGSNPNIFEIDLQTDNLELLDPDDQMMAAKLVIRNILGESAKIKFIENINLIDEFTEEHDDEALPIQKLKEYLGSII